MATVYSVSQINTYIKNMFANDYLLREVQIKGELSNVKYHSSGHIYFSLKEEGSAIGGVMFRSAAATGLDFTLENGQSVVISGNVATYERDGRYQIYARQIVLDGRGNLYEAYEQLKNKLYEEGLFDFEIKKPIPSFPKKVGIVTAKTGAAIQDIRNIARRRNPYVQLYLYPALVQGEGAARTIAEGIETLDKMGLDTIIVGRGGGSIEDLWPFNEEVVAYAIYHAKTPIISGTGHEIDNTIADYVADLRAPTPSAACELAIPDVMSTIDKVKQYEQVMRQCISRKYSGCRQRVATLEAKLNVVSPQTRLDNRKIYIDRLTDRMRAAMETKFQTGRHRYDILPDRMRAAMETKFQTGRHRYDILLARLDGLSPTARLTGGYGYIEVNGTPCTALKDVAAGDEMKVTVKDGEIYARVTDVQEAEL